MDTGQFRFYNCKLRKSFYLFQEGTITNPTVCLTLSAVRIFLSLTTVTATAGNSASEIVMFS